jgi:hypothetical protein
MENITIGKAYQDMTPAEKREADRRTRMGGENEARGSEDAMKARNMRPMDAKKIPRARRKMDR